MKNTKNTNKTITEKKGEIISQKQLEQGVLAIMKKLNPEYFKNR